MSIILGLDIIENEALSKKVTSIRNVLICKYTYSINSEIWFSWKEQLRTKRLLFYVSHLFLHTQYVIARFWYHLETPGICALYTYLVIIYIGGIITGYAFSAWNAV